MIKKILLFIFLAAILSPLTVDAQIDPRCWRKTDCEAGGGTFYQKADATAVCGQNGKDAAGNDIGFCIAAGTAETAVSFGGTTEFTNIGTFINFIYRYGVTIAGVLAVLMIIVAGVQWVLSAGSPERIGAAKKRIAGATVGVLIAALSYVILNTINPYLVNLRLPQVWMVNRQGLAPPQCDLVKSGNLAYAGVANADIDKNAATGATFVPANNITANCGSQYFVQGTGGQTCLGTVCENKPAACYRGINNAIETCHTGSIAGIGYSSSFFRDAAEELWVVDAIIGDGWTFEWFDSPRIYAICAQAKLASVRPAIIGDIAVSVGNEGSEFFDEEELLVEFRATATDSRIEQAKSLCADAGGVKGYALYLEFDEVGDGNDEEMFIGRNASTKQMVVLGEDNVADELLARSAVNQYLFTEEEIKTGYYLRIDVTQVCDIDDEDADRARCYAHIGGWKE